MHLNFALFSGETSEDNQTSLMAASDQGGSTITVYFSDRIQLRNTFGFPQPQNNHFTD